MNPKLILPFFISLFFHTVIFSQCLSGNCDNGKGTYRFPSGATYSGHFQNGEMSGYGVCKYPDGSSYEGEWKGRFPEGYGVKTRRDGTKRAGTWSKGLLIKEETEQTVAQKEPKDDDVSEIPSACISGDCNNGNGIFAYSDGSKYEGQFRNRKPEGQGTWHYPNGDKYVGTFLRGLEDGQGILYRQNGEKVNGFWQSGELVKKMTRPPAIAHANKIQNTDNQILTNKIVPSVKVWAVVVGISAYDHMPVLKYTDDDAYRIYAFLKSPEGGALQDDQIRVLIDDEATKNKITGTMREIFGQASPNDLIVLYFSGHGLKGCFLPIDYDGFNNKLMHDEITTILKESPAKYKLCIADACHSGGLVAMKGNDIESTLAAYYRNLAQAGGGTALIMSSKSGETSLESSGLRQGVFSHFLIRGLKGEADANNDKMVTIKELSDFIQENVRSYTGQRQSPSLKGDYDPNMPVSAVRNER